MRREGQDAGAGAAVVAAAAGAGASARGCMRPPPCSDARRIRCEAAAVSDRRGVDPRHLPEAHLGAPEAPVAEARDLEPLRERRDVARALAEQQVGGSALQHRLVSAWQRLLGRRHPLVVMKHPQQRASDNTGGGCGVSVSTGGAAETRSARSHAPREPPPSAASSQWSSPGSSGDLLIYY
jgi:hypothetical protein